MAHTKAPSDSGEPHMNNGIVPGQIRVIKGTSVLTGNTEPVELAIVSKWDDGIWLVVPVTPRNACTDDEFRFSTTARTAQCWAAETLREETLDKFADTEDRQWAGFRLSDKDISDVKRMLGHVWMGEELPAELSARCGKHELNRDIAEERNLELGRLSAVNEFDMREDWNINCGPGQRP